MSVKSGFQWRSPTGQLLVMSGSTVMFECFCGHQLEYVKILRQTEMKPYGAIVRGIVAERGILALWDGFLPWGFVQAVSKGAVFGWAYAMLNKTLKPLRESGTLNLDVANTINGAGAGGVQGLVLSPTLLLKTRVMTDPEYVAATTKGDPSMKRAVLESCRVGARLITTEGVSSLMIGAPVFALKRVGDWGTRYALTSVVERVVFNKGGPGGPEKLSYTKQMAASCLGGFFSAASTIPLDVLVANIQSASADGAGPVQKFVNQYKAGGLQGIFGFATRGFLARSVHVALTTVVVKTGSQMVMDVLDPPAK